MNEGIMSGMAPVRMQKGGFPDLTGDGKVTQKDILRGRGIQGFADGGEANIKMIGKDGMLFDPYNPLDWAMGIPGIGWLGGGIKALSVGNKLRKLNKAADTVSKLSNPVTNTASLGALGYITGDVIKEVMADDAEYDEDYIDSEYKNPSMAYLDEDSGSYFYYDPEDNDYYSFENNQVPEGYTLEQ